MSEKRAQKNKPCLHKKYRPPPSLRLEKYRVIYLDVQNTKYAPPLQEKNTAGDNPRHLPCRKIIYSAPEADFLLFFYYFWGEKSVSPVLPDGLYFPVSARPSVRAEHADPPPVNRPSAGKMTIRAETWLPQAFPWPAFRYSEKDPSPADSLSHLSSAGDKQGRRRASPERGQAEETSFLLQAIPVRRKEGIVSLRNGLLP